MTKTLYCDSKGHTLQLIANKLKSMNTSVCSDKTKAVESINNTATIIKKDISKMKMRNVSNQKQLWGAQQDCDKHNTKEVHINVITPVNYKTAMYLGMYLNSMIEKGYIVYDQNNHKFTKLRCINMVNFVSNNIKDNLMGENGIMTLDMVYQRDESGSYTADKNSSPVNFSHMGALIAQCISIKNTYCHTEPYTPYRRIINEFGKAEIVNYSEEYDEYRSAGAVNTKQYEELNITRCDLDNPITIITDDIRLFRHFYKNGVYHDSLAKSFKCFKWIYSRKPLTSIDVKHVKINRKDFVVVVDGDFSGFSTDTRRKVTFDMNTKLGIKYNNVTIKDIELNVYTKLFGITFDKFTKLNDIVETIEYCLCNFEDCVDTVGNSVESLMEIKLPKCLRDRLYNMLHSDIFEGKLALNMDDCNFDKYIELLQLPIEFGRHFETYYEDSSKDEENSEE